MIRVAMVPWRADAPELTDAIAQTAIGRPVVASDDRVIGKIVDAYPYRNVSFGALPMLAIKYELTETDGDGGLSIDVAVENRVPAVRLARFVPSMRVLA